MITDWKPNLVERMFLRTIDVLGKLSVGHSNPVVNAELVRTMGVRGSIQHMTATLKVTNKLQEAFGHSNAQYLIGLSSLFIGCGFCTYSHVLSGALLWFRDEGSLHPLDPHVVSELFAMRDKEIALRLESLLAAPEHQRLRQLVSRMHKLYLEEVDDTHEDDALLEACLWIWRWTTECSIVVGITFEPDDAHPIHAVGRDRKLRERFEAFRDEHAAR